MTHQEIDYDSIAFVSASTYRQRVLTDLADGPQRPSDMADDDLHISHVSRSLGQLRDAGLVELLVSEDVRKGRYYDLTERGASAVENLEDLQGVDGE